MNRSFAKGVRKSKYPFKQKKEDKGYLKDKERVVFDLCFHALPSFVTEFACTYYSAITNDIYDYHGIYVVLGELKRHTNMYLKCLYERKKYKKLYLKRRKYKTLLCSEVGCVHDYSNWKYCLHSTDYSSDVNFFVVMGFKKLVLDTIIKYNTCKRRVIKLLEL